MRLLLVALIGMFAALPAGAAPMNKVILQGLDKVTARVSTLEARVGEVVRFGTLEIIARSCDKRPPEEPPESAAFLDIWEIRPGEPAVSLFRGWMFASSPALNALEHPVYDIWVLDCAEPMDADSPK
ncbi:MAG: glycosyl hydrolase family 5 [Rhodospirillaceae bacterium]|nr:glycosyl hydrolase family 5 [Rhodospirillaceae bacterium]